MLRLLLTPRWIGRLLLLLAVVAACWWLGSWQWDVAHTRVVRSPPAGTSSLPDVHQVGTAVDPADAGRRIWMRGTFDASRQVIVVDRQQQGAPGSWVVTAFEVSGATPSHAVIPVVRGWLPQGEQPPAPPTGEQRITGWLEPTEPDALRDPTREPLPDGDVQIISSPELLSLWRPPLFQGFVLQDQPPARAPLAQVSPPTRVVEATDWQNGAYAIQWWLFGVFAIFWFFRMVRVELEDQRANQQGGNGTEVPEHPGTIGRMDGADSTDADGTDSTEQKGSP